MGKTLEAMARLDQLGDLIERLENLPSVRNKVIVRDKMREVRREIWQIKAQLFETIGRAS